MAKKKNSKFFNLTFSLKNVEAESAGAVAEMVIAFASMLGVVLKHASAELVAYLHKDGYYYPYRQPRGRGMVYKVESTGPRPPGSSHGPLALEYFIYLSPGREMAVLHLTHDRPSWAQVVPHWEDLRKLPRSARIWIRLNNEAEPSWHRVTDVLRESTLPAGLTKSFDCIRRSY
jgi:hypothetical protein